MSLETPPANHRRSALLLALVLAAAAPVAGLAADPAATSPAAGEDSGPGLWRAHQVELRYLGFTSTYSCDGLQSKLQLLLRRLGARPDATVVTWGCDRGYGTPSQFVRATLKFATLEPAATGASPAVANESTPLPAGSWRHVLLAPREPSGLAAGDCELMEQFRDLILPLFATRAVHNRIQCVPYQESVGAYSLEFDAFAPVAPAFTGRPGAAMMPR
jgi:hypothetical protein